MGEFDLIRRYFSRNKRPDRQDVLQNIGDDCAVVQIAPHQQVAITTDTLVSGTHFLSTISPADLAYKSVAVNLSDLAAMGAKPTWVSLALTLSEVNHQWLSEFSQSLFAILDHYDVSLIGGDTTKGNLSITLTAQGLLNRNSGLFRHNAQIGDWIFVSGSLGDSAAGLDLLLSQREIQTDAEKYLLNRHFRPTPRVELGQLLTQFSQCAIDISDGLLADLRHILDRSKCGAKIFVDQLPLTKEVLATYSQERAEQFALTGGEDYELCFTISPKNLPAFENALAKLDVECNCIGQITESGLTLEKQSKLMDLPNNIGFDHFK